MATTLHCWNTATGTVEPLNITKPTSGSAGPDPKNVAVGDLLIIVIGNDDATSTAQWDNATNKPTGFTLINEAGDAASDCHIAAFYRVADGSEASTVDIPCVSDNDMWAFYILVSGAHATTPLHLAGADVNDITPPIDITGVTTTVNDCLAFYLAGYDGGDDGGFSVSGTGWSESAELHAGTGAANASGCWGTRLMSGQGATGTATVTPVVSDSMIAFQFAIAPSAGAAVPDDSDPPPIPRVGGRIAPSLAFWLTSVFLGTDGAVAPSTIDDYGYLPGQMQIAKPLVTAFVDDSDFVFSLPTIVDDDSWLIRVTPQRWVPPVQAFLGTEDFVPQTVVADGEDFWRPVTPQQQQFQALALFDSSEIAPQPAAGTPEEDAWLPPVLRAWWVTTVYLGTDGAVAPSTIDESAYQPPAHPLQVNRQYAIYDPAEIAAPAPSVLDEDFYLPSVLAAQTYRQYRLDDSAEIGQALAALDDDAQLILPPPVQWQAPVQAVLGTDDTVPHVDEDDWWQPPGQQRPVNQQYRIDDDSEIVPFVSTVTEDHWSPPPPWQQQVQQLWIDDSTDVQSRLIDTDFYIPPLPWPQCTQWMWIDDSTNLQSRYVDEDYWNVPIVAPTPTIVRLWYGDDEVVTQVAAIVEDTEWLPSAPCAVPTIARVWLGDEEVVTAPPLSVDDDAGWIPKVYPSWWTTTVSLGTDGAVAPSVIDETGFVPWPLKSRQTVTIWIGSDDCTVIPQTAVEDEGYIPPAPKVQWSSRVFRVEDDRPTPPVIVEDESGFRPAIIKSRSTVTLWIGGDEVLRHMVEDEGWIPPRPWQTTLTRPVTDTGDWVPLFAVEEQDWLPPILPSSWRTQAFYADDEIAFPPVALEVSEDYWRSAQSQVILWLSQPFTDDEIFASFVPILEEGEWVQLPSMLVEWRVRTWWGDEEVVPLLGAGGRVIGSPVVRRFKE